jgi:surface antigen
MPETQDRPRTLKRFFCLATGLGVALALTACASSQQQRVDPYAALTDNDVAIAAMLLQRTLDYAPDGTTRRWTNDQSGHSGAITPVRSYIATTGQYCRDYQEDISVDGERRQFLYSACRDEDRWGL